MSIMAKNPDEMTDEELLQVWQGWLNYGYKHMTKTYELLYQGGESGLSLIKSNEERFAVLRAYTAEQARSHAEFLTDLAMTREAQRLEDERERNPIQIFVKAWTGKTITLDVKSSWTIQKLKKEYEKQTARPPMPTRFIFAGRQLKDSKTLADYKIQDGSNIHDVLRLGGPPPANDAHEL